MESDSEDYEDFDVSSLNPRSYQLELLQKATEKNIIAFLDTGTGKTLIALLLMKEMPGKSVFLAPKRILVRQQCDAANKLGIESMVLVGESTDSWGHLDWQDALNRHQALFLTPELFLNSLRAGYLMMQDFKLMIFDECHHCNGKDPYMKIMIEFYHVEHPYRPKILGLTASPISTGTSNRFELKKDLQTLCNSLDSSFVHISRASISLYSNDPKFIVIGVDEINELMAKLPMIQICSIPMNCDRDITYLISNNGPDILRLIGVAGLQLFLQDIAKKINEPNLLLKKDLAQSYPTYSKRFYNLIDIILKHSQEGGGQVIVLAQKRIVTWYLSQAINLYSEQKSLNLKSASLIGKMTRKLEIGLLRMSDQRQVETLQEFRSGLFNVLVSTTVAEEGVDVPSCDLVIRFDHMSDNLTSYVQSKGRARDQNSKFVILTDKANKKKCEERLHCFDETIKYLKEIANTEISPSGKIKVLDSFQVTPAEVLKHSPRSKAYEFPLTGAKVSENWSIEFIDNFCRELDRNKYGKHTANFLLKHIRPGSNDLVYAGQKEGYLCVLKFPKILEISDVQSKRLHQKDLKAKQDAAVQGVKLLYEKGFLNVNLRPYWLAKVEKEKIDLQDPEIELVDEKGMKLRARKKVDDGKQTTLLPQDLCLYSVTGNAGSEFFIYSVQTDPEYPAGSQSFMGVLAPCLLELYTFNVYPFNVFRYSGLDLHRDLHSNCRNCKKFPFAVSIKVLASARFSEEQLYKLKMFHLIVSAICKGQYKRLEECFLTDNSMFSPKQIPVLFVPLTASGIDFDLVDTINLYFQNDAKKNDRPSPPPAPGTLVKSKHKKEFFLYLRTIPEGLHYEFEDKNQITTISEYFHQKYNLNFSCNSVAEVKSIGGFRQCLRPRIVFDHKQETLFIPSDLVDSFPLPTSLYLWLKLSPNIFHKMNQSFLTNYLRSSLKIQVSHKTLLESITCGSALEGLDYQRLEILGDSVLKLVVSDFLFKSNPKDFEGMLTSKRVALTCNNLLFKKALDLRLYRYMQAKVFTTKSWKPQGLEKALEDSDSEQSEEESLEFIDQFGFDKILDEEGEVKIESRKDFVELSHKQLADCVEALIGAVYVSGSLATAGSFIKSVLGLAGESSYSVRKVREAVVMQVDIPYKFKNPDLLVEALTHSTAQKGFDYNRLEFLGDAVIDFLVMDYFYNKFPEAGPGSLSKMKAYVVSNRTFSYISHKIGLGNHLVYSGIELKSDLAKYKENAEKLLNPGKIIQLQDSGMKVMADLFESVTGAIFIDSGEMTQAYKFVMANLAPVLEGISPENCMTHPHNRIFDYAQRHRKELGSFRIERYRVKIKSDVEFITKIYIQEKVVAEGRGSSKLDSSSAAVESFFKRFTEV